MDDAVQLINLSWVLLCAGLVLMMQAGFICLETGLARAKNSINVAIKRIVDFCIASIIFWLFGYALMFGTSIWGVLGTDHFLFGESASPRDLAFFLFQLLFCGIATTIISGGVAERMRFHAYLLVTVLISSIIYPVIGHWVWASGSAGSPAGFLKSHGFIDFAGSTVVHSMGGWVSLAAILVVGPRLGRFNPANIPVHGHDLPMAALGMFLMWFGWFGFNGGSTYEVNRQVSVIFVNTALAGASGGLGALGASWWLLRRADVPALINGVLAGLVGITASAHIMTPTAAVGIGFIAGILCTKATLWLERREIDDVVGAVPVHAFCGAWGTIAVALFGNPQGWANGLDRWGQLQIQVAGALICFLYAFGTAYVLFSLLNKVFPLRVSAEDERMGLNMAEHGASTALIDLVGEMEDQRRRGDFSRHVSVEPHTEIGEIAREYNQVLDRVVFEQTEREAALLSLKESKADLEAAARELETRNVELTEARDQAVQAARAKSEFLATMSHEIRTPLNGILGMAELLRHTPLSDKQQRLAETVHHSGSTLLQIINDILDFAKIESGRLELECVPFDVRRVVEDMADLFGEQARVKGLELKQSVAADVPLLVNGDPTRLSQVLMNLVSNAIKFTKQGEVTVSMTLAESSERGVRLQCEVRDTGIGIPASAQEKIFESFAQVDGSTTRKYGGSGLGLAIVKQLVHAMEGEVGVRSHEGQGSTFWFTVSLKIARMSDVKIQICSPREANARDSPLTPAHVLLAEDNPVNRGVALGFLEPLGCRVDTVTDGEQAVEACRHHAYHLILMDCQMPVLDGYAACGQIRELDHSMGRHTPIIALTAHALQSDRERCLAAGMDDYLSKPFTRSQLIAIVQRWAFPVSAPFSQNIGTTSQGHSVALSSRSTACLDETTLQGLRALRRPSRPDAFAAILARYLESSTAYVGAIRQAIAELNASAVFQAAHAMKSSSGMVGALALAERMKELEALGRSGDLTGGTDLFIRAEQEYCRVRQAIESLLAKEAA
jgi:ammonium transporter, Amt family